MSNAVQPEEFEYTPFARPDSSYAASRILRCRDMELAIGERTLIMGILNVTPDSFSDGGQYDKTDAAVRRAFEMVEQGADLIDIGGESTRPGHVRISPEAEIERVVPVIEALRRSGLPVPLSIDTYKAEVARAALAAGAHMLNDIWGLKENDSIAAAAKEADCPVILMHNRHEPKYARLVPEVLDDLKGSVDIARRAGIDDDLILLDPGIGFGKTYEHNLLLMNRLHHIAKLGFPIVLGTSRKRMIRQALQVDTMDAVEGTAATVALGIAQGCAIMRVHDVAAIKRTAMMMDAMIRATELQ